ncbi:FUSC family protein [Desulfopila sp. IMCC35008]|uniref:FUSC family protein n=1 Tax=Desulfopila sp. IMCC35008 TaxID=2653858 RepID=UPI0013CF5181|nr:FUSC family protein [Desulfopila sp. IMCC35008]
MKLSRRAKEAIKTALAATIAIGIALSLDWENAKWAGFAVAFVSLATIGQSFTKAVLRILGTLFGAAFTLFILGLYPQERWMFMIVLTMYLGFCAYRMTRSRHQYFWQVSGFVCAIVLGAVGPDPANGFHMAMNRTQVTGLGILVYTVVTLLLWPVSSQPLFAKVTDTLASTQQQMLAALLKSLSGEDEREKIQILRTQVLQAQSSFNHLMEGAISDTYEVWEVRYQWRRYASFSEKLTESMERLWESLDALQGVDLHRLTSNLDDAAAELNMRLSQIHLMLTGKVSEQRPVAMTTRLADDVVRTLPPLQKAALMSTHARLTELFVLTKTLYDIVSDIRGGDHPVEIPEPPKTNGCFLPDPDGLKCAFFVMLNMWLAFLAVIYIDALPGGYNLLAITGSLSLAVVTVPQLPMKFVYPPLVIGLVVGGVSYAVIMPHLSTFFGLSILLFAGVFGFCYVFSEPKQMLGKAAGLALFFTMTTVTNHQSYSILLVTTLTLMFCIPVFITTYSVHVPFSNRPEKVFLCLLRRYFRSCRVLISGFNQIPPAHRSWFQRVLYSYHLREIETMPRKISSWIMFIDSRNLQGTTPQQIQAVQFSMLTLSYRMQELLEEQNTSHAPGLEQDAQLILEDWHKVMLQEFAILATAPGTDRVAQFRRDISEAFKRFEERIESLLDKKGNLLKSEKDSASCYRLVGACRGVSDAMIRYTENSAAINWQPWHEERF